MEISGSSSTEIRASAILEASYKLWLFNEGNRKMKCKEYAESCGWRNIVFEVDAKNVMEDVLESSEPASWYSFESLIAIRRRISSENWKLEWSPRESNQAADSLAKFSITNNVSVLLDEFSLENLPLVVLDLLSVDQLSIAVHVFFFFSVLSFTEIFNTSVVPVRGLGNMGSRMASNLFKAGYKVAVPDINQNVMQKFSDMGVDTKRTPFEVAEASEVVITMLPSSSHVDHVYTGPNGLLHGGHLLRPCLLIDSSTIDPQTSRKLSATISNCILKERKDNWEFQSPVMLDAPVSGGVLAAEAGTLTFLAAKICNNLAMAISMLGVSEALALVEYGILRHVMHDGDTYNPVPGVMGGVPSSRNYDGGFASKLMAKDLNLAATSAEDVGLKCPLTSQAQKTYTELCHAGYENKDFSCVFRHYYHGKNERESEP
ncbi:hypothetical protein FNV43_RR06364 [Rhamnella rubrinervis]|uniref:3-hydroxyisobutyrate dehydrogenase n=1 Tax=Rhamnella rubrinervis TaxID=2594499 RepID=A0A8K0HED7_9ROSA|nr:hypothetical protein FNV43_RR06364 [Rhamnella rubrinervis]